jgi:hypothetical protein
MLRGSSRRSRGTRAATTSDDPMTRSRHESAAHHDAEWTAVSERDPCPICGEGGECRRHSDGAFVFCMRLPSEWPLTNGAWLHRVGGADP